MTTLDALLLVVHCLATCVMTGIIWFVQLVHYPLLSRVGEDRFTDYENDNTRRTSWVVGPAMLAEATTAVTIAVVGVNGVPTALALAGLALLTVTTLSTAVIQVPIHRRLSSGFDLSAISRLVAGNWIRTGAWSARAVIAAAMLVSAIPSPHPG